jgi:single-stranded-DNA-specific exonuclease
MRFRWSVAPASPALAGQLARQCGISPLFAQCLINRGLHDPAGIAAYIEPRLRGLSDPFLLPGMEAAVQRLFAARERGEQVTILGDYDVDGVTSTTLLLEFLQTLGWRVQAYIPDRFDEGYGLSLEAVDNCLKRYPAQLLLAVDCGSTSVQSIARLKSLGVDVIVLDHHQISDPAPAAVALVNPRLLCPVPVSPGGTEAPARAATQDLCSAGLAFKLAHALLKRGREQGLPGAMDFDLRNCLDLVALGTVADLVPLLGENRILVATGLERLSQTKRPGLIALKEVSRCNERLGPVDVGFQLAPRLNAAGRVETAQDALNLLTAKDPKEAAELAQKLDTLNRERQRLERSIAGEAMEVVRARFNPDQDYVIVEGQDLWHVGVVGIVASRVLQQFYRPTIIVGSDGVCFRGSGRSIQGFDLAAALRECGDLLLRHGGHAMAAGVSLSPQNLEAFRSRLNEVARTRLKAEDLQRVLRIDCEATLGDLTLAHAAACEKIEPCGQGNPLLHFFARNLTQQKPFMRMGAEKQHVKMWVTDGKTTHEAVWWGAGKEPLPEGRFDLAFVPEINEYNGRKTVQLKVLDWRDSTPS